MFHKLILAVAIAALSAGLAHAQVTDITKGTPEYRDSYFGLSPYYDQRTPEQVGREVELERQYREVVRRIPDKKPSGDPWKSIRTPAATSARTAITVTPDRHRIQ